MTIRSILPASLQTRLLAVFFLVVALIMIWLQFNRRTVAPEAGSPQPAKVHTTAIRTQPDQPLDQNIAPPPERPNAHKVTTVPVGPQTADQAPVPQASPPQRDAVGAPSLVNSHTVQTSHPPASSVGPPPTGFTYAPQGWDHFQR
jgi:hypothetical protein